MLGEGGSSNNGDHVDFQSGLYDGKIASRGGAVELLLDLRVPIPRRSYDALPLICVGFEIRSFQWQNSGCRRFEVVTKSS